MKRTTRKARWEASIFEYSFKEFRKDLDILCEFKANDASVVYYKEDVIDDLNDLIKRLEGIKKLVEEA